MKVHQTFKVVETKSHKYIVCYPNNTEESPCLFYMRAILSKKTDAWKVTHWGGPHTCLNMTMTQDHEKLDSNLIATCVVERINSEFSYKVSYRKAWMAKQKAIAIEYGDWEESYAKLSSWLTHMQNHSPGSYFQILHDDFIVGNRVSREHHQFHRVFWTFGQCKEAFKYCKPIIQVDGTHLYDKYRRTLLMATSQDGNGGVLPLAFAVVEGETLTAWSWFLAHLREHVTDKNGICLISDRHAIIKSAVANEHLGWQPPHGYHVYCVRHIASNFNRKFNNAKQKEMFKKLAYTPCKHVFDQNLEKFRQLSPAIARWIDRISKEKWSMTYDTSGRRYGHMTTNLSECVNKVLKDCRSIPITGLVKSTYSRCRKYFVDRGRQAQRQLREGQVYCSKLVTELRKNQEQACSHIVRVYDIHSTRFEVEETFNPITQRGGQKWAVNLNDHYCQCGRYFALHYPCSHIIAACGYVSMNYYQYIDVVYTNEHILKAYSAQWWPLGNEAAIPHSDEAWTLIPDPTTIRAKGMRWIGSNHLTTDKNVVDVELKGTIGVDVQCNLTVGVLELGHDIAVKGSLWAMKNELVFPQNHRMIAGLQKYQCDDPEKDTDTSVSDTQQIFVACNTFHGHAPPFVGNILPLQQCPFFCLSPEFQYLTEACETVVREIDALMRDHVTLAQ
ncbi:hypothetical protein GmHk_16G045980 [Glycine max]|nr:hypothetical protein GmHk_16G045980 [Glycine max]